MERRRATLKRTLSLITDSTFPLQKLVVTSFPNKQKYFPIDKDKYRTVINDQTQQFVLTAIAT